MAAGVTLPAAHVHSWLEHLDHKVPQLFVDTHLPDTGKPPHANSHASDITSRGAKSAALHHQQQKQRSAAFGGLAEENFAAEIDYKYRFKFVETSPAVAQVIDRVLRSHHRLVPARINRGGGHGEDGRGSGDAPLDATSEVSKVSTVNHFQVIMRMWLCVRVCVCPCVFPPLSSFSCMRNCWMRNVSAPPLLFAGVPCSFLSRGCARAMRMHGVSSSMSCVSCMRLPLSLPPKG